jgi:hypothetical protein
MNLFVYKIVFIFFVLFGLNVLGQEQICDLKIEGQFTFDTSERHQGIKMVLLNHKRGAMVSKDGFFTIANLCKDTYVLQTRYFGDFV